MVSIVNSHANATRIGWNLWEIDSRFALGCLQGGEEILCGTWLRRAFSSTSSAARRSVSSATCGTEAGSYLRLTDSCITQLKAQGPSRTCHEIKEEAEAVRHLAAHRREVRARRDVVVLRLGRHRFCRHHALLLQLCLPLLPHHHAMPRRAVRVVPPAAVRSLLLEHAPCLRPAVCQTPHHSGSKRSGTQGWGMEKRAARSAGRYLGAVTAPEDNTRHRDSCDPRHEGQRPPASVAISAA